jgi:retinol dehydrogenase 12
MVGNEKERRVAIVTGSNSGIGKETALALAHEKYSVVLACRNIESGKIACEEIKAKTLNENVFVYKVDVSSIASIKEFVLNFKKQFAKLNLLVNNAGITTQKYEITSDGFEKTIETNLIGPFILTKLLLPLFVNGEDNRIVNVCSDFYKYGKFNIDKLNDYHWTKAYAVSKYAVLLITIELADELKKYGITVNSLHPGVVRTKIMLTHKWYDSIINLILSKMYIDAVEGSKTSIYLSISNDVVGKTGGYYIKNKETGISAAYNNIELRKSLYKYCNEIFQKVVKD